MAELDDQTETELLLRDGLRRQAQLPVFEPLSAAELRRPRFRGWLLAAAAVGLIVAVGIPLLNRADRIPAVPISPTTTAAPASPDASWEELPPPPLTPRYGSLVGFHLGSYVVIGGQPGVPCPLVAADGCEPGAALADAAEYHPVSREWTRLPELPAGVSTRAAGGSASLTIAGSAAAVLTSERVYLLDLDGGTAWQTLPSPGEGAQLSWLGDRLVAVLPCAAECPARILRFDPAAHAWQPAEPLGLTLPAGKSTVARLPGLTNVLAVSVVRPGEDRLWVAAAEVALEPDDQATQVISTGTPVPAGAVGPIPLEGPEFGWAEPGGSTLWVWNYTENSWRTETAPASGGFRWWQDGAEYAGPSWTGDGVLVAGQRYDAQQRAWATDRTGPPAQLRDPVVLPTWFYCFGYDPAAGRYADGCYAAR
ncbi:MAG: hypothetical protein QM804_09235 [Propionicimonas sp.]